MGGERACQKRVSALSNVVVDFEMVSIAYPVLGSMFPIRSSSVCEESMYLCKCKGGVVSFMVESGTVTSQVHRTYGIFPE